MQQSLNSLNSIEGKVVNGKFNLLEKWKVLTEMVWNLHDGRCLMKMTALVRVHYKVLRN